jgi:peptide deformylase
MREELRPFVFSEHTPDEPLMLARVLFERMQELGGVGLSANQLGLPHRVFVMGSDHANESCFNPEILEYLGEPSNFKEGCLSYPGLFMQIKRPPQVRVRYQDSQGKIIETLFSGLTSRIFQHEYEHMQGTDFTQGVSKLKLKIAQERYAKNKKKIIKKHALNTMLEALKHGHQENSKGV